MKDDEDKVVRAPLQMEGDTYTALRKWCKSRKKSVFLVVTAMADWFMDQPDGVKTGVLADTDDGMELVYAEAFERLAKGLRDKVDREHAAAKAAAAPSGYIPPGSHTPPPKSRVQSTEPAKGAA